MSLARLAIRNFRSLRSVELELKPITILIGPNGSGKSNLFKALRFLAEGITGDILDWQRYDRQLDDLLWYGIDSAGNRPDELSFVADFDRLPSPVSELQYRASLRQVGESLEVDAESLARNDEPLLERHGEQIERHRKRDGSPLKRAVREQARSPRNLTLRDEGLNPSFPGPDAVYREIAGWRYFEVDARLARQEQQIVQFPDRIPPLLPDASNLSAFLYALYRRSSNDFDAVVDAVSRAIELPQRILVQHDADLLEAVPSATPRSGKTRYFFIESPFGDGRLIPADAISDGTIRLLAHSALLLADSTVTMACLEEPDVGLHPRLMLHLASTLRLAVTGEDGEPGGGAQIVLTTHSPELLDCFDLAEEAAYLQVYVAERSELGETVLTPVTAREFAPWLEKYRLGEAVRRRVL